MTRLAPEALLAGVSATLEHDILPALTDRAARGLVFAALEVLANVKDLVEWKASVREEELSGAAAALAAAARVLADAGLADAAAELDAAGAAAQELPEREARGRALDAALERALVIVDSERTRPGVEAAAAAIRAHLVNQTVRDVMRAQRPLLDRISQG
jgi:hypothetical protein